MTDVVWGATPEDWALLSDVAGLTEDLLPVVSNPGARIDPESKLKTLGKVPSLYNSSGLVVGIGRWTQKKATHRDIDRWQDNTDLGICVQTRQVRALDVDIDDADTVARIRAIITEHLGGLPTRGREDSTKVLLAFTLPGEFTKRILKTEHGAIEFLATGQQFIAVGTHPKGARYEWDEGGTPCDFPEVRREAFEACWAELMHQFAIDEVIELSAGRALKEVRRKVDVPDETADFLFENNWVKSESRDGRLNIVCPFEHEHSGPSADDTATQYMPAGVGGFEVGHFKCLHAHCANRNDGDFLEAIGVVAAQFDVVELSEEELAEEVELPRFARNPETGKILGNLPNAVLALRSPAWCGVDIATDTFRDELMITPHGKRQWRPFRDADYARLRLQLINKGLTLGVELLKEAVSLQADDNRFDSAKLWLEQEVPDWDGVCRIEGFFPRVFGAEDNAYSRAVGLYTWTALAGRVLDPGCKADMVPILRGSQGLRKSSAVMAMVPDEQFFTELDLSGRDDDSSRLMRGKLIAELGELKGLHNREIESVKAFITRRFENWIPKFKEFGTTFPRRLLFIGTTNRKEFLADETGNRRWLPLECAGVDVGEGKPKADVAYIEQWRDQLWAEARDRWMAGGVEWREAERLAEREHENFRLTDSWEDVVREWLEDFDDLTGEVNGDRYLHSHEVLVGALRFDPKSIRVGEERRLGTVLTALGYERKVRRVDGRNVKVWVKE